MSGWIPGPPPGRGRWWVYWHLNSGPRVECVEVSPALIHYNDPNARLLIKMLGGAAYEFAPNRDDITHHIPLETPVGPGDAPMPPRFTLADLEAANESWGCNCGPGALAAICGLTLDDVRPHLGERWPGYTNPTTMTAALRSLWRAGRIIAIKHLMRPDGSLPWPSWGLCRIQWEGPWTQPGVPMRARYRFTHWIGAATDPARGVGVFDINVLANGSGWCSLEDWSTHVAPVLAKDHNKRASGGWHVTHAIEVTR